MLEAGKQNDDDGMIYSDEDDSASSITSSVE